MIRRQTRQLRAVGGCSRQCKRDCIIFISELYRYTACCVVDLSNVLLCCSYLSSRFASEVSSLHAFIPGKYFPRITEPAGFCMKAILHLNIFCTHRQGLWKAMVVQGRMDACPVFVEIFHLRFTEEILYWDLRALTPCHNIMISSLKSTITTKQIFNQFPREWKNILNRQGSAGKVLKMLMLKCK